MVHQQDLLPTLFFYFGMETISITKIQVIIGGYGLVEVYGQLCLEIPGLSGNGTPLKTYLFSLLGSGKILSGQHGDSYAGGSSTGYGNILDTYTNAATSAASATIGTTGKCPAIVNLEFPREGNGTQAQTLKAAQDWQAAGGIVQTHFSAYQVGSASSWPSVLTPNSAAYNSVYHDPTWGLDVAISMYKQLSKTFILRLFPEMNYNGWWYGYNGGSPTSGTPTAAQFMQLYRAVKAYIIAAGVTNALFIWDPNWFSHDYLCAEASPAFSASDFDLLGIDFYASPGSAILDNNSGYATMVAAYPTIPIILCECGGNSSNNGVITPFTIDNSEFGSAILASAPNIVGSVIFSQKWQLLQQNNPAGYLNSCITRSQLPALT